MHLGKRPRANSFMRRTTSMASLGAEEKELQAQESQNPRKAPVVQVPAGVFRPWMMANFPRVLVQEPTHFLQVCFRCKERLRPGRDIYMYRGDGAFCSAECRTEQIFMDESLAKCMAAARKKQAPPNAAAAASSNPRQHQQSAATSNQNSLALL